MNRIIEWFKRLEECTLLKLKKRLGVKGWIILMSLMIGMAAGLSLLGENHLIESRLSTILSLILVCTTFLMAIIGPARNPVVKVSGPKLVGVNQPCVCGSGKKYKKCCLNK
jgi:uncharacterized protein YecA (UPF0149 family)